jgi:thiamine kinase-like enzyme
MPSDDLESMVSRHVPGEGKLEIHRLGSGLVNETYRVLRDGRAYALRVAATNSDDLGLDRAWEARVLQRAVAADLAPELTYYDPQRGILIARWVDGRLWSPADVRRQSNIARVAALMRRIHALPMPMPARTMNPAKWIEYYGAALTRRSAISSRHMQDSCDHQQDQQDQQDQQNRQNRQNRQKDVSAETSGELPETRDLHGLRGNVSAETSAGPPDAWAARDLSAAAARRLAALAMLPGADPVICHSDLHTLNLVDRGNSLVLLDWEYAHAADPLWDLAGWSANNDLEDNLKRDLLASYTGRPPTCNEYLRLELLGWLYDYVCLLWSELYLSRHRDELPGVDTAGVDTPGIDTSGIDTPGLARPGADTPGGIAARARLLAARLNASK